MNFAKFLRIPILQNTSWRLLLDIQVRILMSCFPVFLTGSMHAINSWTKGACSKLTKKTSEQSDWHHLDVYIVNLKRMSHFPLNKWHIFRSSLWRCSVKIAVLRNFTIFLEKHLRWSLFLTKFQALMPATLLKRDSKQVFSSEYSKIFSNTYLEKRLRAAASMSLLLPSIMFLLTRLSNLTSIKRICRKYFN